MSTNIVKKPNAPRKKRARITKNGAVKFLTRAELAERWRSSKETIKRKQRAGLLHPIYLSSRKILYALAEIEGLE